MMITMLTIAFESGVYYMKYITVIGWDGVWLDWWWMKLINHCLVVSQIDVTSAADIN